MNKLVSILLGFITSVINILAGTAIFTFAIDPSMLDRFVLHIPLFILKIADTVGTIGFLTAIKRATTQQRSEFRQSNAIHLMVHDMVDTLLPIRDLFSQTSIQPFDNLTKENSRLTEGIDERGSRVAEQLLRQHIQHLIGQCGWGKHLVVAEVGDAV